MRLGLCGGQCALRRLCALSEAAVKVHEISLTSRRSSESLKIQEQYAALTGLLCNITMFCALRQPEKTRESL